MTFDGKHVVLVTGVGGFWGGRLAARLAARPGLSVIGLHAEPLADRLPGVDYVQAGLRNPLLPELLSSEQVEVVCHLDFDENPRPTEASFEHNVMGTMNVLAACTEAGVRQVVLRSSTQVYGAQPDNSAFLREDQPLNAGRAYGYLRDLVEIEEFVAGFRSQTPQVGVTVLRFAPIVGPEADTPLTRFLRDEEALVLMGFDPVMQVIHEADVLGALEHAVLTGQSGTFNVAAADVLPLWKLIGLSCKLAVPVVHPAAYAGVSLLGQRLAPMELDYLRYRCVGDLEAMRTVFGFAPAYTAAEALREFAARQRLRAFLPEAAARARDEARLRDTLERRRRLRERLAGSGGAATAGAANGVPEAGAEEPVAATHAGAAAARTEPEGSAVAFVGGGLAREATASQRRTRRKAGTRPAKRQRAAGREPANEPAARPKEDVNG